VTLKTLLTAAAIVLPAFAAVAQTPAPVGNGALSGRSPIQAYKTGDATNACGRPSISLPAGKLPTYGLNGMPSAPCPSAQLVRAEEKRDEARD